MKPSDGGMLMEARRSKIIVLAAGKASRLLPLSELTPKPLITVNGEPILHRSLRVVAECEPQAEVVVVVGYRREQICAAIAEWRLPIRVRFVVNDEFATTNSIWSLWLTRSEWAGGFALLDGDVCIEPDLCRRWLKTKGGFLVVDTDREWQDIDMKVYLSGDVARDLGKSLSPEQTSGEFFGVSKFNSRSASLLAREVARFVERGERDVWYEFAFRELVRTHTLRVVRAQSFEWFEIDTAADLREAELRYAHRIAG